MIVSANVCSSHNSGFDEGKRKIAEHSYLCCYSLLIELDVEDHYSDVSVRKRKNKSGKKLKKGHGSSVVSTSTLLHSSMF